MRLTVTEIIGKLKTVDVLSFATLGADGASKVRCISAIHYENNALYVFTARGKHFAHELQADPRVEILGYVESAKEMIRISAKARTCNEEETSHYINEIFTEQPYMANVYPGDTRNIGIIFEIKNYEVEYFHLGERPIYRESHTSGDCDRITPKGYRITDDCIGCGTCVDNCPQHCIEEGSPFVIHEHNCLHCGNCYENCPVGAIAPIRNSQFF